MDANLDLSLCLAAAFPPQFMDENRIYEDVSHAFEYRHSANWIALRVVHLNRHMYGRKGLIAAAVRHVRDSVPELSSRRFRRRSKDEEIVYTPPVTR